MLYKLIFFFHFFMLLITSLKIIILLIIYHLKKYFLGPFIEFYLFSFTFFCPAYLKVHLLSKCLINFLNFSYSIPLSYFFFVFFCFYFCSSFLFFSKRNGSFFWLFVLTLLKWNWSCLHFWATLWHLKSFCVVVACLNIKGSNKDYFKVLFKLLDLTYTQLKEY